jgi:hypothetical protein
MARRETLTRFTNISSKEAAEEIHDPSSLKIKRMKARPKKQRTVLPHRPPSADR